MRTNVLKAVTAIVLGAGFLASAVATPPSLYEEVTVKVQYADLNIQNEAGARVLYQRLKDATAEVCDMDSYAKNRSLSRFNSTKQCYSETLTQAVNKIDSDVLTSIHAG